ncbi:salivary glue protein Sgs-3-like [Topomyia yanbarensis]|uniref:salivary glue protein Sgs-3-like n=1 Tax=Topomyia yanbarensis TaxID=2498891 RepID=UPI00273BC606|nr:salivary glue protein Sgs-3-like [Topomyia yanbarensis]
MKTKKLLLLLLAAICLQEVLSQTIPRKARTTTRNRSCRAALKTTTHSRQSGKLINANQRTTAPIRTGAKTTKTTLKTTQSRQSNKLVKATQRTTAAPLRITAKTTRASTTRRPSHRISTTKHQNAAIKIRTTTKQFSFFPGVSVLSSVDKVQPYIGYFNLLYFDTNSTNNGTVQESPVNNSTLASEEPSTTAMNVTTEPWTVMDTTAEEIETATNGSTVTRKKLKRRITTVIPNTTRVLLKRRKTTVADYSDDER